MRILDENDQELESYDEEKGYVMEETINGTFHPAQKEVQQKSHYIVIKEYPETGGKDVEEVIDVPYQPAREAYYDKENILRYRPYPEDVLAERKKKILNAAKLESLYNSDVNFEDVVTNNADMSATLNDIILVLADSIGGENGNN